MALLTVFERRCPTQTSSSALLTTGKPSEDRLRAGCRGDAVVVMLGHPPQVQNISLAEGETLTVESAGGLEPTLLANESFLLRGQVIRSPANLLTLRFQSPRPPSPGSYCFRYQAYLLSCPFPARPAFGEVSVSSLHPGGDARFRCAAGYQLQGAHRLTCRNHGRHGTAATDGPSSAAVCGGVVRNATVGRIVSPGFPGNYSNNLTCHWLLEAPAGHRLHLHFEKVSLAEDDDRFGTGAPPVYDSYEVEYLPIEGLLSTGRHFFVELTTDSSGAAAGMALRYEAFEQGHCYEPFVKYGNFTASDSRYPVGTTVEFSCDPGYTLEQGSTIIECVDPSDPQWNETEPACRAPQLSRAAVAKAVPSGTALEGTNVAIAVFLPMLVVALLIGGIYLYFSKLQGKPALQLPLAGSHPYDHITVESAFDNPTYETGETREYEVSI
uniref:Seizure related 6 homolog n=1 Tax=Buteo japonicus TaxID=224669 RepID=A0A8C0HRA4_9AVES